jgi:hypothetical protein
MVVICKTDLCSSTWRAKFYEELGINFRELFPVTWNVILVVNSLNRADRLASATIYALIRLDVEHSVTFIDAIHWALFDAGLIFHIDTWLGNHICHEQPPKGKEWARLIQKPILTMQHRMCRVNVSL